MSYNPSAADVEELADLCEALIASNPSPGLVANPLLHVLSAHPSILARYDAVWSGAPGGGGLGALKSVAKRIRSTLGSPEAWLGEPLPSSVDILFISHFLPTQIGGTGDDLYFGTLPEQLSTHGASSVVARINHTGRSLAALRPGLRPSGVPRLILSNRMSADVERSIGATLKAARIWLLENHGAGRRRALATILASSQTGEAARTAMRIAKQVEQLVRQLRPKLLVTTYEGHSWERLSYRAARAVDPAITCVGYNHAVLFPKQRAMGARLSHGYDPDVLLTAGDITREHWLNDQRLTGIPVDVLGSVRSRPRTEPSPGTKSNVCLVLPEGLITESRTLAEFALSAAATLPQISFRLRLHPTIARESLLAQLPQLRTPPTNVQWSTGGLDDELSAARWAIYRGTSTIIQAVQSGVRPLYLALASDAFDVDPLSTLTQWRLRIADLSSLARALDTSTDAADLETAQEFCARYFAPMNAHVLLSILRQRSRAE